jgi:hypothetical protein
MMTKTDAAAERKFVEEFKKRFGPGFKSDFTKIFGPKPETTQRSLKRISVDPDGGPVRREYHK